MGCDCRARGAAVHRDQNDVAMAYDCYCVPGAARLDGDEVMEMEFGCHLAHGGVNPVLGDAAEKAIDGEHSDPERHLTN
jgi:hypothetical protein